MRPVPVCFRRDDLALFLALPGEYPDDLGRNSLDILQGIDTKRLAKNADCIRIKSQTSSSYIHFLNQVRGFQDCQASYMSSQGYCDGEAGRLRRPVVGLDGTIMDSVFIPKGTTVLISVVSCHRNKDIWGEDALDWKPERWLSPLPDSITKAQIPGVYSNL